MEGADLQLLLKFSPSKLSIAVVLFALAVQACAQTANKEPAAVLELGAAGDWSVKDLTASFGAAGLGVVLALLRKNESWMETATLQLWRVISEGLAERTGSASTEMRAAKYWLTRIGLA